MSLINVLAVVDSDTDDMMVLIHKTGRRMKDWYKDQKRYCMFYHLADSWFWGKGCYNT
jgi:hypothetical protein